METCLVEIPMVIVRRSSHQTTPLAAGSFCPNNEGMKLGVESVSLSSSPG